MSDLVRVKPDIKINLFIAAQNERLEKIASENHRPTFARPKPPLPRICRLRPRSQAAAGGWSRSEGRIHYLKPKFISEIAAELRAGGNVRRIAFGQSQSYLLFLDLFPGTLLTDSRQQFRPLAQNPCLWWQYHEYGNASSPTDEVHPLEASCSSFPDLWPANNPLDGRGSISSHQGH